MAAGLAELTTRAGAVLARERAVLPALPAVGVFLAWAAVEGGYSAIYWYPGALALLPLLVIAVLARDTARGPRRLVVVAFACLAAYTAWSFASIAWAQVRAEAWDGANRTALYLTAYGLFALLPWTIRGAWLVLGTYAFGVAGIAAWTLARAATSAEPLTYFRGGIRFSMPTTYHNANCALFTFALIVLVYVACRRGTPLVLRPLAAAGGVVLIVVSLLGQSRGWLGAVVLSALFLLAISPARARIALAFAALAGGVAPVVRPALALEDAAALGEPGPVLDTIVQRTGLGVAVAAACVLVWALADRVWTPSARVARSLDRGIAVVLAGAVVIGLVAFLVVGSPRERVSDAWNDFTEVDATGQSTEGHLFGRGVTGSRYDLWRVALRAFERKPIQGVGADNFAVDYFRERRTLEEPRYPHSLELRALSQTGIVGALLLGGFFFAALAATWPRRRSRAGVVRAAVVAGAVYWLVHGSIDWFWEIPGVSAPVFAALGLAAALPSRQVEDDHGGTALTRSRRVVTAVAIVAAGLIGVSHALPLLSELYVRDATRTWRAETARAFASLDRARRLNPLADRPDLVAGAIASRLDRPRQMRARFAAAVERNPSSWYGFLELGIAEALTGRPARALAHLGVAERLNPREVVIEDVIEKVRAGEPVDPDEVDAVFLGRLRGSPPAAGTVSRP